ncbi:hypothetical protein, partial [Streptomyces albidoflavus]|uniref:hypothetical protein n=1 Tax=Streptomyces albidoflavus TaxID=1886 RepID=UPI001C536573
RWRAAAHGEAQGARPRWGRPGRRRTRRRRRGVVRVLELGRGDVGVGGGARVGGGAGRGTAWAPSCPASSAARPAAASETTATRRGGAGGGVRGAGRSARRAAARAASDWSAQTDANVLLRRHQNADHAA